MDRRRIKNIFILTIFAFLVIGIPSSLFHVGSTPLDSRSRKSMEDEAYVNSHLGGDDSSVVKVVEHRIGESELERLKSEAGVWQNNTNYNKIISGHGTGLRPPTESEWARISEDAFIVDKILWTNQAISQPPKVDHSTSPWFPPIGNQDGKGSCVAFSVGYYIKTFQEAEEHEWDLSGALWEGGYYGHPSLAYQDMIFSPDFIYHQVNGGVDGGATFEDAIDLICSVGACTWAKMPYDYSDSVTWPSEAAWRQAPLYRGNSSGIEYLYLDTDADIESLKNWIASGQLATIGVDGSQYDYLTSNDVWTLDNYVYPSVNHANTIVGYDDDLGYSESGGTRYGAFKIANSWGEGGWENVADGCYWISYEAMKQRVQSAMFYRDRIAYEPKIVASFRIDDSERDSCEITLGIGNKSAPVGTKILEVWYYQAGSLPFCSNNIIVDITEFLRNVSDVIGQQFFLQVYEGGYTISPGSVLDFSVEYYEDYSSQIPQVTAISDDPPVDTLVFNSVYAEVTLVPSISITYPSSGQHVNETISITGNASQYRKHEVYSQDFNHGGSMPSGWSTYSEGPDAHPWTIELRTDCEKDYWAECNSDAAGSGTDITEWLYMTGSFNASGYASLDLEFYSYYRSYDGDEYAEVLYATKASYPNFYELETWNLPPRSSAENHHHINLDDAAGDSEVHLAFVYHATYDWYVRVDNVVVYGLKALDKVATTIDDESWQTATGTTTWSCNWDTTAYSDGNHTITARAYYGTAYTEASVRAVVSNNLIYIDQFLASDDRCNVGSTQTVMCHGAWARNGSSLTEGTIWLNGTGNSVNGTGWSKLNVTSDTVGKDTWTVTGVSCKGMETYEVTTPNASIIFDRVKISAGGVTNPSTNITQQEKVWFKLEYEYDGASFSGEVYINGTLATHYTLLDRWEYNYTLSSPGKATFTVSKVVDNLYGLTSLNDAVGPLSITWIIPEYLPIASLLLLMFTSVFTVVLGRRAKKLVHTGSL